MILLPLVFLWARAPMTYGLPSKLIAMVAFVVGAATYITNALPRQFGTQIHAAESWESGAHVQSEESPPRATAQAESSQRRLREGTKIAATTGKFLRVGRRWAFEFEGAAATTSSGNAEGASADVTTSAEQSAPEPTRIRVLENLALQRAVEAITLDSNDVRWTITGVVTEYEGENWLLLSTLLRAGAESSTMPK